MLTSPGRRCLAEHRASLLTVYMELAELLGLLTMCYPGEEEMAVSWRRAALEGHVCMVSFR